MNNFDAYVKRFKMHIICSLGNYLPAGGGGGADGGTGGGGGGGGGVALGRGKEFFPGRAELKNLSMIVKKARGQFRAIYFIAK